MEAKFQIFMILLAVLAGTALLARRINIAPAILLMVAGIALAFVPGMPAVELPPDLVLLMVLPPLIYSASVAMSWREFKSNLRPIILLAVGCVIFTAFMVAAATHYLIGLPWSVGFLLGAIVAPPDVPGSMNGTTTIRRRPSSSTASCIRYGSTASSSASGVRSTVWFG